MVHLRDDHVAVEVVEVLDPGMPEAITFLDLQGVDGVSGTKLAFWPGDATGGRTVVSRRDAPRPEEAPQVIGGALR